MIELWECFYGQKESCGFEASTENQGDLYGELTLVDNSKQQIFSTNGTKYPINDRDHAVLVGVLPLELHITAEHTNDYIQFSYGEHAWTNNDHPATQWDHDTGEPYESWGDQTKPQCELGRWDPLNLFCGKDGDHEKPDDGQQEFTRQMDCCFPC